MGRKFTQLVTDVTTDRRAKRVKLVKMVNQVGAGGSNVKTGRAANVYKWRKMVHHTSDKKNKIGKMVKC